MADVEFVARCRHGIKRAEGESDRAFALRVLEAAGVSTSEPCSPFFGEFTRIDAAPDAVVFARATFLMERP